MAPPRRPTLDPVRALPRLLDAARTVRLRAHAPYSKFKVGAAVLADDGRVYAGCNVENASYGLCICAERSAMVQAISRGARRVVAAAVATQSSPPSPPCGMCLQTFVELGAPSMPIVLAGLRGAGDVVRLQDLLPRAFDASLL